ncbi:hypothetical protein HZ326_8266 [Fusarium oxysporum f. sp. albedinis]|nr:hypothetical protein HZ326_8266 [Fusarium oxysporum f. sp. albedinis]
MVVAFATYLSIVKLFLRLEVNDTASVDIVFIRSLWFSSSHRPNSRPSTPWGFLPSGDSVDSVTRGNNFYFAAYFSGPFYLKCREKSSDSISRDSGLNLRQSGLPFSENLVSQYGTRKECDRLSHFTAAWIQLFQSSTLG